MRRFLLVPLLWYAWACFVHAQSSGLETQFLALMSGLDQSQVPTGILADRTPGYVPTEYYDGTRLVDSLTVTATRWSLMYGTMERGRVVSGVPAMPPFAVIDEKVRRLAKSDTLHLGLLLYQYGRLRPDALTANLIRLENGRFVDVAGRTQSPYLTDTLFAVSTFKGGAKSLTVRFRLGVDMVLSNLPGTVPDLQVDFEDGLGYRTVQRNTVLTAQYSTYGLKRLKYRITIGSRTLNGQTAIMVKQQAIVGVSERTYEPGVVFNNTLGATVTWWKSEKCGTNRTAPRSPLIFIGGFDPGGNFPANIIFGALNQGFLTLPNGQTLIDALSGDRDLFYIYYDDSTLDMKTNAETVKQVIRQINLSKGLPSVPGGSDQNIVVGASAGGVIGKIALRQMEMAGEDHETEVFITLDAPLKGANITLGMQAMLTEIGNVEVLGLPLRSLSGQLGRGIRDLNSPAARQLLYYHYAAKPDYRKFHDEFYNWFEGLGNLSIPHVAIANGAQNGTGQTFGPGANLLDEELDILKILDDTSEQSEFFINLVRAIGRVKLKLKVNALPSGDGEVFRGEFTARSFGIRVDRVRADASISGAKPYDSAPGGIRQFEAIPGITWKADAFCFIPTISALGLNTDDPNFNASDVTVNVIGGRTNAQNYYGSNQITPNPWGGTPQFNQPHVAFTPNNATFLYSYINKGPELTNPLSQPYNFGRAADLSFNLIPRQTKELIDLNLTVGGGGRLWVNRSGRISYTSNTTHPLNNTNSTWRLFVGPSACSGTPITVDIASGGQMEVGQWDGNAQNKANVFVRASSTLQATAGGQIFVNANSNMYIQQNSLLKIENAGSQTQVRDFGTLFVQNGGRVEVNNGGLLNVTDANGRLEVQSGAEVRVRAGGILRMSNKGGAIVRGGGRLILESGAIVQLWDGNNDDGESFVRIESGGTLRIEGDLNLSGNGFFWFKAGFVLEDLRPEFNFTGLRKTCRLFRFDGVQLNINRSVNLSNLQIEYLNSAQFRTTGGQVQLTNVSLEGYKDGSVGLWSEQSSEFIVTGTNFIGLSDGLIVHNNPVFIQVSNSLFKDCGKGISGNATFMVSSTMFTIWDFAGIEIEGGSVTLNNCKMDDGNQAAGPAGFSVMQARMTGGPLEPGILSFNGASVAVNGGSIQNCETGIFMNSGGPCNIQQGASISSNQVGIHAPNGGNVFMNCSQLTNNGIGVLGVGPNMEVADGCNLFGIGGGFSKLFYLCNTTLVAASGNRWIGDDSFWNSGNKWHITNNNNNCYYFQGNLGSNAVERNPKCETLLCPGQPPGIVYDMEVRVTYDPTSVLNPGSTVLLKIIVSNKSDNITSSGKVKFTLPAGLNFVSMQGPPGMSISTYDWANRQFYFTSLFAGSELEVVVQVQIDAGFMGNRLTVVAELAEDNNTNNPWLNTPDIDSSPNNNNPLEDDQNELLLVVTPAPLGPLTSTISQTVAQCQANGTITLSVSGGKAPYRFDWADMAGNSNPQNRINLPGGTTYTVTVFDANGSTLVSSAVVARNEAPSIAVAVTHIGCNNPLNTGFIDLTVTGASTPYAYTWSDWPHTFQDRPGMAPNTYTVTVTSANGCSATASMVVQRLSGLTLDITSKAVSCYGQSDGSLSVQATSGAAPYTYAWPGGFNSSSRTNLAAGTYTVTVSDSYNCSATAQAVVAAPASMVAILVKEDAACGQNNGSISTSISGGNGGYRFDWADISGSNDPGDRSNLASGTYNVTVRDNQNCVALASTTIGQSSALNFSATPGGTGCAQNSGSITLSIQSGTGPYTFNWADLSGSGQPQNRASLAGGTYAVTVTDNKGCSKSTTTQVTQSGGPTVTASATSVACFNSTNGAISLNVSGGAGGYAYDWSDLPGQSDPRDRSNLAAGTYNVTVHDAAQCSVVRSITVAAPSAMSVSLMPTHIRCYGAPEGAIMVSVLGGVGSYTYDWTDEPGTSNGQNRSGLRGGSYTVVITDANGCKTEASVTVQEPPQLILRGTPAHPTCTANIGAVNLTVSGGRTPYTYSWSNGQVTEDISNLGAGTYGVTVTDANGCSATWNTQLTSPPSVQVSTVVTNINCNGGNNGSITLAPTSGQAPFTYNFHIGGSLSNPTRLALHAGTYYITVTDNVGCTATLSLAVTQPLAISTGVSINQPFCPNNPTVTVNVSGGTPTYSFKWSDLNGGLGPNPRTASPGSYVVTVVDRNNCTATNAFSMSCTPFSIPSFNESGRYRVDEREQIKNGLPHDVVIYPNPTNEAFTIQANDGAVYQYRLIDGLGRVVHSGKGTGATSVPAAELPPGLYHVRVEISTDTQSRILWKKVVVVHP